ncbi:hypothetical protein SISSUDRAFT_651537 [Sistotremastrum suecicum HHB10207 ss-3]|uniref:Uncharacterized protein n=1 Tax=Sistotremastrum suecicum HHB10207 ss-3 TaxID=1314776 RepID=A0A166E7G7_9AGAM|nr:hypothetical protein SISSUDRAFT_651537 [Sistotremastrum suecicum HHB10207 ss-3]
MVVCCWSCSLHVHTYLAIWLPAHPSHPVFASAGRVTSPSPMSRAFALYERSSNPVSLSTLLQYIQKTRHRGRILLNMAEHLLTLLDVQLHQLRRLKFMSTMTSCEYNIQRNFDGLNLRTAAVANCDA